MKAEKEKKCVHMFLYLSSLVKKVLKQCWAPFCSSLDTTLYLKE